MAGYANWIEYSAIRATPKEHKWSHRTCPSVTDAGCETWIALRGVGRTHPMAATHWLLSHGTAGERHGWRQVSSSGEEPALCLRWLCWLCWLWLDLLCLIRSGSRVYPAGTPPAKACAANHVGLTNRRHRRSVLPTKQLRGGFCLTQIALAGSLRVAGDLDFAFLFNRSSTRPPPFLSSPSPSLRFSCRCPLLFPAQALR